MSGEISNIKKAIAEYARAYRLMEDLQKEYGAWIPVGDQKTGVIGEFYAKIYLKSIYPGAEIKFAEMRKPWDLEVRRKGKKILKIQVKTVSEHARYRRISPIHKGYDELFLILLDLKFRPIGLWIVKDKDIEARNRSIPIPGKPESGSKIFANREERTEEFLAAIEEGS